MGSTLPAMLFKFNLFLRGFDAGWKQVANIADDCHLIKQKIPIRPSKQANGLLQSTVRFSRENAMPDSYHRDAHFIAARQ